MNEERDPIIDSLLEELLGNQSPPDLTERIMRAHHAKIGEENTARDHASPNILPSVRSVSPHHARLRRRPQFLWAYATTALVLIGALGGTWYFLVRQSGIPTVVVPDTDRETGTEEGVIGNAPKREGSETDDSLPDDLAPTTLANQEPISPPGGGRQPTGDLNPDKRSVAPLPLRSPQIARKPDAEVIQSLDGMLASAWQAANLNTGGAIDESLWCERTFHVLLGRPPSDEERNQFLADRRRDKRPAWVRSMTDGPEFAAHWSSRLSGWLLGNEPHPQADRTEFERYLRGAIFAGTPYQQIVYNLLTASGVNKPIDAVAPTSGDDIDHYNGGVNYLLAHQANAMHPSLVAMTNRVSQHFLGNQLQCAQCHDHPAGTWTQKQYWEFASFFAQVRAEPLADLSTVRLIDRDYQGEVAEPGQDDAEVFYSDIEKQGAVAYPVTLDGTPASSTSGRVAVIDRREELARWLVSTPTFSQAAVNQMWQLVFGRSLLEFEHEPLAVQGTDESSKEQKWPDDFARQLSDQFTAHQFDLRRLIEWIVLSDVFERPSESSGTYLAMTDPNLFHTFLTPATHDGSKSWNWASWNWGSNAPRLSRIETRMKQIAVAGREGKVIGIHELLAQEQNQRPVSSAEAQAALADIQQRLLQSLSEDRRLLDNRSVSLLDRLAQSSLTDRELVEHLFWAVINVSPSPKNIEDGIAILNSAPSKVEGLQELSLILLK